MPQPVRSALLSVPIPVLLSDPKRTITVVADVHSSAPEYSSDMSEGSMMERKRKVS